MARNRRINQPGAYHHITARGVDKCAIFEDDDDRRQFLALLSEARKRFGCQILAFCLMTNHVHLTIRDDFGTLSKTQHLLNGVYAKRFNHKHERTGHLFERRFWSSMLDSDAYLTTCVAYVHQNPVKAGLVDLAEDYRWSSYPSYVGRRSVPNFLNLSIVLDHYGNDLERMRSATAETAGDSVVVHQLRSMNPPAILGADAERAPARVIDSRLSSLAQPIALDDVLQACADAFDVGVADVKTGKRGRRNPARGMTAFIAQRHGGHSLKEIASALGLRSPAAASVAAQRFAEATEVEHHQLLSQVLATLGVVDAELLT